MKKLSKILCAVLVLAVLCSSFVFLAGAQEEPNDPSSQYLPGFTSVVMTRDDGAALLNAVKYPAEDNLLTGAQISDGNDTDSIEWGNEGGRGSELITHTESGNVIYKEYLVGTAMENYGTNGNDFINYKFPSVDLTKEDGYNKYMVVDFDFAYQGALDNIAMQIITRGNGAYWATPQYFKNFGIPADTFVHITAVYDYTNNNTHVFVNGKLAQTVEKGCLNDTGVTDYESGVTMGSTELRIGSNSKSTIFFDNLYVRSAKNAVDSDELATVLSGANISAWSGFVYGDDYTMPLIPYHVPTMNVSDYANNEINDGANYKGDVSGNMITSIYTGNKDDSSFITFAKATGKFDPFFVAYAKEDVDTKFTSANNRSVLANTDKTDAFPVIGDDVKAYYVIDLDMATLGDMFTKAIVSVVMRQEGTDGGNYPFSDSIYLTEYVKASDKWSHVTVIGDVANNKVKVFVNGTYVGDAGRAVSTETTSDRLGDATAVHAFGFRLELTQNNYQTTHAKGETVSFDNLSYRLYADGNDALKAAIESGSLSGWEGNVSGRAGEQLPLLATVNGVEYRNAGALEKALSSNDTLEVVFHAAPVVPVEIRADATITLNGMAFDKLLTLGEGAELVSNVGGVATVTAPAVANRVDTKVDYTTVSAAEAVIFNATKGNHPQNLYNRFNPVSSGSWGTHGYRYGVIIDNPLTGDSFYYESADVDEGATTTTGTNEYVNFFFNSVKLVYEEGKNDYVVMDYDMSYEGVLDGKMYFGIIPRNSGGRWASSAGIRDLKGLVEGEMVHVTAVHDYVNNKAYYFFNGVLMNTVNGGAINAAGHTEYLGGATGITTTEYKLGSNSLDSVYIDNMIIRSFDLATAEDTIDDAVAAGDITKWTDNIFTEDYVIPQLPALVNIDGVEIGTADEVADLLYGNDKIEVTLLHPFTEAIAVRCPAVINTQGFAHNFVACEGGSMTVDGDILTFTAPYVGNDLVIVEGLTVAGDSNSAAILPGSFFFDTLKYSADDNLFNKMAFNMYQKSGLRASYIVKNPDTDEVYGYDTIYDEDRTAGSNTFVNWFFDHDMAKSGKGYTLGANQYFILDLDMAYDAYSETKLQFTSRNTANANIAGYDVQVDQAMSKAGITAGEFAHVTVLAEVDTNTVYVYVNGVLCYTRTNGISKEDLTTGYYLDGIRFFQNVGTSVKYDNVYMRVVNDATLKGLDTLVGHSVNIYKDGYTLPTLPALATVDGVPYYSAPALSAALYGNIDTPVQVEFLHATSNEVMVACDAVIETHGMDLNLKYYNGKVSTNGTVINFDCGYVSATEYRNETTSGAFTNAVNVPQEDNIVDNIFFNGKGGTWMNASWLDAEGNVIHGLHTYLVSSKGDDNVYGMLARPEGTTGVIGGEWYEMVDGVLTKGAAETGTYINLQFKSANNANYFTYSASENNYWVYDFDLLVEGSALKMYGYNLIKTAANGFQYGGYSYHTNFGDRVLEFGNAGEFNHFTIVADYNNNIQYVFINGTLTGTSPLMNSADDYTAPATAYVEGSQYYNLGYRISFAMGNASDKDSFAIDNTLARKFVTSDAGNLVAAIEAGDITLWNNSHYTSSYEVPAVSTLAIVDGVEYNSISKVEEAIHNAQGTVNVSIVRPVRGEFSIAGNAVIETNNFTDYIVARNEGMFEFDTKEDWMGQNGIVKASGRYILTQNGSVYSVETLTAENWREHAMLVTWYTTPDSYDTWEDVIYLYGHQIVAPNTGAYIENGKLVHAAWFVDGGDGTILDSFPVASAELGTLNYACTLETSDCSFAVTDLVHGLKANTDFTLTLYVPADKTVTTGTTTVIDGVNYLVLTADIVSNRVANKVTFQFNVVDTDGNVYVQYETLGILDYAKALLDNADVDTLDKTLMVAALEYSNEAYAILGGSKNASITEFLTTYADYAPALDVLGDAIDTSAMSSVIRSAALKLDAAPAIAFKVVMGFKGEIKFTYTSLGEEVVVTKTVDATSGEQLILLDTLKVYDVNETIAIEITPEGGEVITGSYNLSTYAAGLENNAFVAALAVYSEIAEEHKLAELAAAVKSYNVLFNGAVVGTYEEGTKITAPEYTPVDGYKAVWTVNGEVWDFDNDVITSEITLTVEEVLDVTAQNKEDVQDSALTGIVDSKIKQCDQATLDDGSNANANGWFTKEGGTAEYVKAVKDGVLVDALYFSRELDWTTYADKDQNSGFTESRWAIDSNVTSITFSYLINGTVEEYAGTSEGTDLAGNTQLLSSAFVQLKTGSTVNGVETDGYPEILNNDLIVDGEWHTFTVTFEQPLDSITHFLVKLYNFNGEMLISNIVIETAA